MPAWGVAGKAAMAAAMKAGQSPAGKKALTAAAIAASKGISKVGADRWGTRKAAREQVMLAESLARQVGAKLSYNTVIAGSLHTVVWSEGKPLAAFPEVGGNQKLEERPELQNFNQALLKDPPVEPEAKRRRSG
jgi:hypothetical protein